MKQLSGSYNQPFTLRPFQIWNALDVRQKTALTIIYQLDNDSECLEHQRLKTEGSCRPSDDWRWMPLTALCAQETTQLRDRLLEAGIVEREALDLLHTLEMRGLIRCQQDRWSKDNRLFVRILFLGQRVVRDGQPAG